MEIITSITFENFISNCITGWCQRNTIKSIKCLNSYKQERCYKKYCKNEEKKYKKIGKKISELQEFRNKVLERDKTCRVWNILLKEERLYVLKIFQEEYLEKFKILDICHALSKARNPELIWDINNVFLGSRYFHSLLDTYKDLITQQNISENERNNWINRIMTENKIWR